VTFVTTQGFLDHFGLESARDLPGIKELRAAGLLDNRPPTDATLSIEDDEEEGAEVDATNDMFEGEGTPPPQV
jgi:segregation and condensation protein B